MSSESHESSSESPTPDDHAATQQQQSEDTANDGTPEAPKRRLKIGSQRPGRPKVRAVPQHGGPVRHEPKKTPVPSTRHSLAPEDELELAAVMGSASLDDLLEAETGVGGAELEPESRQQARVISLHNEDVFVDLGGRNQGVLSAAQFKEPPQPGMVLEVMVSRFDPADGLYHVALPGGAVDIGDWSQLAEGVTVEARVTGHNKGGLEVEVNHIRGFIPAGQIAPYRVEDFAQFVGEKFICVVTEANPDRRNLVLSRRAILERERAEAREQMLEELAEGQVREGVVRSLQDFGAFVDLGGVDGLLHVSQLAWHRVKHPSELLEVGQHVKVMVRKIEPQTGKISLSLKDLADDPWLAAIGRFPVSTRTTGRVTKIMEFGAFVELEPGIEGLIHISQLDHARVFRVSDVLKEGDEVDVQVLSVDAEQRRISLSRKAVLARAEPKKKEPEPEEEPEPADQPPKPKRKTPLKGGIGGEPGGGRFGLKW